jgi:hypothetical protein
VSEPTWTRAAMIGSYFAACRVGIRAEALILNAASLAGMLLHEHRTAHDALDACRRMPMGAPWARAAELLAELVDAEGADTMPPQSVTVEGGIGR